MGSLAWSSRAPSARWLRAAGVALVWLASAAPVLVGRATCPMAALFGVPCPGCGMTRAAVLLAHGDVAGSLRMHPLAAPSALATLVFMSATVWVTGRLGSPAELWRSSFGRASVVSFAIVEAATFGLWVARLLGGFGGPVPV